MVEVSRFLRAQELGSALPRVCRGRGSDSLGKGWGSSLCLRRGGSSGEMHTERRDEGNLEQGHSSTFSGKL